MIAMYNLLGFSAQASEVLSTDQGMDEMVRVTSDTLLFEQAVVDNAARAAAGWEGAAALILRLRWRGSFCGRGGASWWMTGS